MGTRSEALAARLEAAIEQTSAAIEGCPKERWTALNAEDNWSVGVTAHHIAGSLEPIFGLAQVIALSQPVPPLTIEMINGGNAEHAQQFAGCTPAETLALLRAQRDGVLPQLRALSDEQLARTADLPLVGGVVSAEQVIEGVLIGHVTGHLAHILTPA